jgi:C1A family cysteine protease
MNRIFFCREQKLVHGQNKRAGPNECIYSHDIERRLKMKQNKGMGWERDIPDFRDLTPRSSDINEIRSKSKRLKKVAKAIPPSADLRYWCSPIEDQEDLGSCTANAGVALMEYFQQRAYGKYLDASRLFLYKATRNLLGWVGDQGAYLRTTMKAMVLFGVPPEDYWPYDIPKFDSEPPAFCYAFAQTYKALKYYRLDPPGQVASETLGVLKENLAAGLPAMFGFTVYSSFPPVGDGKGEIPFPTQGDRVEGGHAVVAVGYDNKKKIAGDTGAILIRNSWGREWGVEGYGWLPYSYVEAGLAVDFWSLVEANFADTELFE